MFSSCSVKLLRRRKCSTEAKLRILMAEKSGCFCELCSFHFGKERDSTSMDGFLQEAKEQTQLLRKPTERSQSLHSFGCPGSTSTPYNDIFYMFRYICLSLFTTADTWLVLIPCTKRIAVYEWIWLQTERETIIPATSFPSNPSTEHPSQRLTMNSQQSNRDSLQLLSRSKVSNSTPLKYSVQLKSSCVNGNR